MGVHCFFNALVQILVEVPQKYLFQLYSPCGEFYAQVRDMSFGRGMRFARWKLQGEYNITVSIFAEQIGEQYHFCEAKISR